MKRSRLQRSTPLRQGKPLQRTEFKSSSSGRSFSAGKVTPRRNGPVKARRVQWPGESAEERDARESVWARASREHGYPLCEVCGLVPPTEYQHRKAKAHCPRAEKWAPANGLAVCGHGNVSGCHGRIHQHPTQAEANGWTVKSHQDPLKRAVLRCGARVLLDNDGGFELEESAA